MVTRQSIIRCIVGVWFRLWLWRGGFLCEQRLGIANGTCVGHSRVLPFGGPHTRSKSAFFLPLQLFLPLPVGPPMEPRFVGPWVDISIRTRPSVVRIETTVSRIAFGQLLSFLPFQPLSLQLLLVVQALGVVVLEAGLLGLPQRRVQKFREFLWLTMEIKGNTKMHKES